MGRTKNKSKAKGRRSAEGNQATHERTHQKHLQLGPCGDGMYSGTFRWLESKRFPPLPAAPRDPVELRKGWQGYLSSRSDAAHDLVATATRDPSMLDALSFPVTLLYVAELLQLPCFASTNQGEAINVLVVGASRKAEQRVYANTDYWSEVAASCPSRRMNLYFIGPEVDEDVTSKRRDTTAPSNMTVDAFHGTFGGFQSSTAFTTCGPANTVIIGYNTGFGSFIDAGSSGGDHRLLVSWLPDLYAIAESGIPAVFTCANDYCDMNGEFAIQSRVVGANMLLLPQQSPFSAASYLHEEGKQETAWSRASSFLYVVQGVDPKRRVQLDPRDDRVVAKLHARLDADIPDLHLIDAVGRHFYMGMVLTKEQAARCKALNGATTNNVGTNTAAASKPTADTKEAPAPPSKTSAAPTKLATPRYEILPGARDKEIVVRVLVPDVRSPAVDKIAVDVNGSALTLLVQDKYLLRADLPFSVARDAPVRAELAPPFLLIALHRD